MEKNIGDFDKILRVLIAAVFVVTVYFDLIVGEMLTYALLFVAGVLLITSLLEFCPIYFVFRIKTYNKNTEINDK